MTQPQIASIPVDADSNRVIVHESHEGYPPFLCIIQDGTVLVSEVVNYRRLEALQYLGYTIEDPAGYLVCHCGAFKCWWQHECEHCEAEHADAQDDKQMYYDLAAGY